MPSQTPVQVQRRPSETYECTTRRVAKLEDNTDNCKLLARDENRPSLLQSPRVQSGMAQALTRKTTPSPPSSHSRSTPSLWSRLPSVQESTASSSQNPATPLSSNSESTLRFPSTKHSKSSRPISSAPATPLAAGSWSQSIIECSVSAAAGSHREHSSEWHRPERRPSGKSSELTSTSATRDQRPSVISSSFSSSTRFSAELVRRRQQDLQHSVAVHARSSSVIPAKKVATWSAKLKVSAAAFPAIPRRHHMQRLSSGTSESASAAILVEKINEWSAKIEACHLKQLPARTSELEAASFVPAASKTMVLLQVCSQLTQVVWQLCRTLVCLFLTIIASCVSLQPPWLSEEEGGEHV